VTVWKIIFVVFLVGINAFFVAAEFALVAVRRTRIAELAAEGSRRAISAQKAIEEINVMVAGCQLGITLASLGLGALGEPVVARLFDRVFDFLPRPLDAIATHGLAVVIAFVLITAMHVILGEQVPKNLAIAGPVRAALWVAAPTRAFAYTFRPLIWTLNESANLVLRIFGVQKQTELASVHTPDELAIIVEESERGGTILPKHGELLNRTIEFAEKRVVEAMIPRTSTQALKADAKLDEVLSLAEKTGFSRFPVWKERPDEFIGVVHLKDLLRAWRADRSTEVGEVVRQALLVPESLPLGDALIKMQRTRNHFAIVLDEFGSTSGILTLEDILEELVGEIRDEYDARGLDVKTIDGGFRIPGTLRPDELEDVTGCKLPEGEYETVAGFILERLGRIAHRDDEVSVDDWKIRVANVRRRRILSVDVLPPEGQRVESVTGRE
jgi:CBS domain containing-hemolysin-like protein